MLRVAVLVVVLGLAYATNLFGEHKTYDGYQLFEMVPETVGHQADILLMYDDIELDFWDERRTLGLPTRVLVPPHKVAKVSSHLTNGGVPFTVTNKNYGEKVAAELSRLQERARKGMAFDINNFNTYEDIMGELDLMVGRCPADISCTVEVLGQSDEGRDIKVVRISGGAGRQGYWLDSAIHAREWLSPATMIMILDSFTRNYGTDDDITALIDGYDWHFVPIMNPDGYVYSWTDARLWRKSRNANAGSNCMGTDLNRNYDANWMSDGTSTSPCSDTYGGESAASAVETQIIQAELVRLGPTLTCMWTVHTAAQMWLHSWGHTEGGSCAIADDDADLTTVINRAVDAVEATNGLPFERGNCCLTIYPASGGTMDFAKLVAGIKYTFTPELRGPDFIIDASNIQPSFAETFAGLVEMVAAIEENP